MRPAPVRGSLWIRRDPRPGAPSPLELVRVLALTHSGPSPMVGFVPADHTSGELMMRADTVQAFLANAQPASRATDGRRQRALVWFGSPDA